MALRTLVVALFLAAHPAVAAASPHIVGNQVVLDRPPAFPVDSPELAPDGVAVLTDVAALLVAHPEVERVRVQYFMDNRGSRARAEELAHARVGVVIRFLTTHGVADERLAPAVQPGCVDGESGHCQPRHLELRIVTLTPQERALLARLAERRALFTALDDAGLRCGGMRDFSVDTRMGLVFPADCFFAAGSNDVRRDALPLVQRVARALAQRPGRTYTIGARAPDRTPNAVRVTATRAAALVEALVAAGVSRDRVAATGYGERADEEVYDGPSTLAPGNALVEIAIEPSAAELPAL